MADIAEGLAGFGLVLVPARVSAGSGGTEPGSKLRAQDLAGPPDSLRRLRAVLDPQVGDALGDMVKPGVRRLTSTVHQPKLAGHRLDARHSNMVDSLQ